MTNRYQLVTTPDSLRELTARLRSEPCVALDTEFVWERTFYARLGLVQLGLNDGSCFLLDAVALGDLSPLGDVLADPGVTKILHDAPQDLMILKRATGAGARRVFDTRIAAGFAGLSCATSLQKLLADLLSVELPKGHTRTDWLARPLSAGQLEYAAEDVCYLPAASDMLRSRARAANVEAWMDEELAALDNPSLYEERAPGEQYLRIRAAESLSPRQLAVLRELAAWNVTTARAMDRPRGHVVDDSELVDVACTLPLETSELQKCRRLDPRNAKRFGPELVAAVNRGVSVPEDQLPAPLFRPDVRRLGKQRVDETIQSIAVLAQARGIDPQLVTSRNDVALLLHEGEGASPDRHRLLRGWRSELLGGALSFAGQVGGNVRQPG